jgi:hypothetical protein
MSSLGSASGRNRELEAANIEPGNGLETDKKRLNSTRAALDAAVALRGRRIAA